VNTDKALILLVRPSCFPASFDKLSSSVRTHDLELLLGSILDDMTDRLKGLSQTRLIHGYGPGTQAHPNSPKAHEGFEAWTIGPSDPSGVEGSSLGVLLTAQIRRILILSVYNPLLDLATVNRTFDLLGSDDDVIVLGRTESGNCGVLGIKPTQLSLAEEFIENDWTYEQLLDHVCSLDVLIFSVSAQFGVEHWNDLHRLLLMIESLLQAKHPVPQRTYERLQQFDRKYKLRKLAS